MSAAASTHRQTYRYAFYKFNPFVVNAGPDTLLGGEGYDTLIDESLADDTVNLAGESGDDRYELTVVGSLNIQNGSMGLYQPDGHLIANEAANAEMWKEAA